MVAVDCFRLSLISDFSRVPSLWIVIPTYNERQTIAILLDRLASAGPAEILVVDDNSPDGTSQLIEQLQTDNPHLHLLHRPRKDGLSSAYHQGLQAALDGGADHVIHLDADGSHDPALIGRMRQALETADMVLASRYVAGGSLDIPAHRRWISSIGNWYMRFLLGRHIHDWSTGYKAWRSQLLKQVLDQSWQTVGYACLIEMSWLALRLGGQVTEVPLRFVDRQAGESKFSLGIMLEDLRVAGRLWVRRTRPLARERKKL